MFPWKLSRSRVESIWKPAGLKAPVKQPKSGRSCLDDGSCIQLRPEYANHCLELGLRHNMTFKDIAEGAALLCLLRAISTCTSITKPIQNQAFVPRVVECIPVSTRWFKPPRAGGGWPLPSKALSPLPPAIAYASAAACAKTTIDIAGRTAPAVWQCF